MDKPTDSMQLLAELIGNCIDDGQEGEQLRNCLLSKLPSLGGDCKIEAVLIAQDGCPTCEQAQKDLEGLGIRTIRPDNLGNIEFVPQLWAVDCKGEKLMEFELE